MVRFRKERGFSQEALCYASGISRRHMSSIEKGDISVGVDVVERIATVLEVEAWELLRPSSRKRT
ncbi:MAG: helix-turn-helix transcriptional regulator [Bradyrhizobiaceae bacterium]|nr:helix-turn-helix transcriptional regulator [Bradyrhizobiaceae bacterium]